MEFCYTHIVKPSVFALIILVNKLHDKVLDFLDRNVWQKILYCNTYTTQNYV
jgi:hypothetical protein